MLQYLKGNGFERKIGFEKDPICFKVTSDLVSPNLVIEINDELHFDVTLGDLIQNKKVSAINHYYILQLKFIFKIFFL